MAKTDTDATQPLDDPAATAIDAAPVEAAGEVSSVPVDDPNAVRLRAAVYAHLSGSVISRNTECWNALIEAIPALAASLAQ